MGMGITKGKWRLWTDDLTIRSDDAGSDLMGDSRGSIIADLKPSLGAASADDVPTAAKVRHHAVNELLGNAQAITAIPALINALVAVVLFHRGGEWNAPAWEMVAGATEATARNLCEIARLALVETVRPNRGDETWPA